MSTFNSITISSNGDVLTFVPAEYEIDYDSLSGADSGRSSDGTMHISWILRKVTKLTVKLAPHKYSDPLYYGLFSLIQGQVFDVTYFDYLSQTTKTKSMYCSQTNVGYTYKELVNDAGFELIEMSGESTVPHITTTSYIITVTAGTGGSVSGGGIYQNDSQVTISATPSTGYTFTQWNDGNTSNPRTITVSGNATYTASFTAVTPQYIITTDVSPSGSGSVTGGGTYDSGDTATLTATAGSGYTFSQWQDGNTSNPRTITVTGDATYTATFSAVTPIGPNYFYIQSQSGTGALTFQFEEYSGSDGTFVPNLEYSLDNGSTWNTFYKLTDYTVADGAKCLLRAGTGGNNGTASTQNNSLHFKHSGGTPVIGGNMSTLVNANGTNDLRGTSGYNFRHFFRGDYGNYGPVYLASDFDLGFEYVGAFAFHYTWSRNGLDGNRTIDLSNVKYISENCFGNCFYGCWANATTPVTIDLTGIVGSISSADNTTTVNNLSYSDVAFNDAFDNAGVGKMYINSLALENNVRTYRNLVKGYSSAISEIHVGFSAWGGTATENWFKDNYNSGDFYCPNALGNNFTISRGESNCPSGWTVHNGNYDIIWNSSMSFSDETWDVLGSTLNVSFYCEGTAYSSIYITPDGGIWYGGTEVYDYQTGWISDSYRQIYNTTDFTQAFQGDWTDFYLANDTL